MIKNPQKRRKVFASKFKKNFLRKSFLRKFIMVELGYFIFLFFMLYSTQPATTANTYSIETYISDAYVDVIPNRYDNLYMLSDEQRFVVGWSKEAQRNITLLESAAKENKLVRLTVLKDDWFTSVFRMGKITCVDVDVENNCIFDIKDYNQNQKTDRICGGIAFVIIGILCQTYVVYCFVFSKKNT